MARSRITRAESQQQTRERLLLAATEVFSHRGYHAATVEEIAEAAGYSKGAVYANFASKQELFLTLLDRHLEQTFDALSHRVGPSIAQNDGAATRRERELTFANYLEEQRVWNVLSMEFWLYAQRNEQARERLRTRYHGARAVLAARLRERYAGELSGQPRQAGQRRPSLPVEYLAWAILAVGSGLTIQAYLEPHPNEAMPRDLYATVVEQLLDTPSA